MIQTKRHVSPNKKTTNNLVLIQLQHCAQCYCKVSVNHCLSFPSQSPTAIHFDNCHTASQVMWNSVITDWLLHQPVQVGDATILAGN